MRRVAMVVALLVGSAHAAPGREVLARGERVVALDGVALVVTRPDGKGTPLVLATHEPDSKISAKVAAFLGDGKLLDVTVTESSERDWAYERRDMHYVVDIAQADAVVCVFEGASSNGGEYSSHVTTAAVKRTARAPLAFDVTRTTRSTATQPQPPPPPSTASAVQHYELGADSCKKPAP